MKTLDSCRVSYIVSVHVDYIDRVIATGELPLYLITRIAPTARFNVTGPVSDI
jgi:hypothetical protein